HRVKGIVSLPVRAQDSRSHGEPSNKAGAAQSNKVNEQESSFPMACVPAGEEPGCVWTGRVSGIPAYDVARGANGGGRSGGGLRVSLLRGGVRATGVCEGREDHRH